VALTNPLLSPHPYLPVTFRDLTTRYRQVPQFYLPNLKLVVAAISLSGEKIKGPPVLGTGQPGTQGDAEILNVEYTSL
jgi:hypothetical protein